MEKKKKPTLMIVDDERNTRDVMAKFFRPKYEVTLAEDGEIAKNILKKRNFDLIITDMRMPGTGGMEVLKTALAMEPPPPCIVVTAYGSIENAVAAMRAGAFDFVTKPLNFDELEIVLERALESKKLKEENLALKKQLNSRFGIENIIGKSAPMHEVLDTVRQVAPSRTTVLITGESGTGKELIAQSIHQLSGRKGKFVAVHCAALPANLLESELFGHERGAFTGAVDQRKGRFELADGGTLFLDEISEIDPQIQVKLLRALETRSFERIGGMETINTDTRLLAATNRNLKEMVSTGEFREDLYYRLNVVTVELPPLRKRRGDIPLLIRHFIAEFARENLREISGISDEAMDALCSYEWPGNIRELRNCVERMVVMSRGNELELENVPSEIRRKEISAAGKGFNPATLDLDKNEKMLIVKALEECGDNRTRAAEKLGISRRTLHRKLKEYDIA